jgi:hypothetical protein
VKWLWLAIALCACEKLTPPTGPIHQYVVSGQRFAGNQTDTPKQVGVDLTDDRVVDNQLGSVLASFATLQIWPFDDAATLVHRGDVIMLAQVQTSAVTDPVDAVALTMLRGANPDPAPCIDAQDTTCGRHLQGGAHFDASDPGELLLARRRDLPYILATGTIPIAFAFYGTPIELTLVDGRVELEHFAEARLAGRVAGWLDRGDLEAELIPILADTLDQKIANECSPGGPPPDCGCPPKADYNARWWLGWVDIAPRDCSITTPELLTHSPFGNLLPADRTIEDRQMLSFGFGFEAVPAQFAP